jgi:hypothetical protein
MTTFDPAIDDTAIADDEASTHLFPEDTGALTLRARKALVLLLKRHHVWAWRNPREWLAILDWQDAINSRLNDLFLELVIDEQREIAYKRQAGRDLGRVFTTLLHDSTYTREEAGLLLHLREVYLRELRAGNDSAYIDRADLAADIDYVRPAGTKDHKKADQYLDSAVGRLLKDGFLVADKSDRDRLRISPVIEVLLTVERLTAFRDALEVPDDADADDAAADADVEGSEEDDDDAAG